MRITRCRILEWTREKARPADSLYTVVTACSGERLTSQVLMVHCTMLLVLHHSWRRQIESSGSKLFKRVSLTTAALVQHGLAYADKRSQRCPTLQIRAMSIRSRDERVEVVSCLPPRQSIRATS